MYIITPHADGVIACFCFIVRKKLAQQTGPVLNPTYRQYSLPLGRATLSQMINALELRTRKKTLLKTDLPMLRWCHKNIAVRKMNYRQYKYRL